MSGPSAPVVASAGAVSHPEARIRPDSAGLETVIPWEWFRASVEEAEALAQPEKIDAYQELGEHHAGVRR